MESEGKKIRKKKERKKKEKKKMKERLLKRNQKTFNVVIGHVRKDIRRQLMWVQG